MFWKSYCAVLAMFMEAMEHFFAFEIFLKCY